MIYTWVALLIVFAAIELITPQLVCIWFAIGSLGAFIAASLNAPLWQQILIFIVVSVIMIFVTRPLYKRFIKTKLVPTNSDRLIGDTAVVTETIDNLEAKGAVKVQGQVWSARSENGEVIPENTPVTVVRIEGVKLIVK
ncbi:MAG: NfeD family protein [Clostridia bacterium]|nr:NfeD family protein [Clostridia bacterium]